MIHYFLNTTIVWLVSLMMYELLYRKESFHQYNRIYLLGSMAIGLILPLLQFNSISVERQTVFNKPVVQFYEMKRAMVANQLPTITPQKESFILNFQDLVWIIYGLGVLITAFYILKEFINIIKLYKDGNRTPEQECIVIQTGKDHSPFSFFNLIFVRSRLDYSQMQWSLLMAHEKEHSRKFHSADNLILILLRIIFWFHPLVYIYFKKLRVLHEFQADEKAGLQSDEYGQFLIEQSLLQGSPIIVHSINYSPISKRIIMLTKNKSSQQRVMKYLAIIPILIILLISCSNTIISNEMSRNNMNVNFKGNEIQFGQLKVIPWEYREAYQRQTKIFLNLALADSVAVQDWTTGITKMIKVTSDTMPISMNGKPIFGTETQYEKKEINANIVDPVFNGTQKNLEYFIFASLKKELDKLENGAYVFNLHKIVIDDKGKVAYYENPGIYTIVDPFIPTPTISSSLKKEIINQFTEALDHSAFTPAQKNGKRVHVRYPWGNYQINVKNHIASMIPVEGC